MGRIVKGTNPERESDGKSSPALPAQTPIDDDAATAEITLLLAGARATANAERAAMKDVALVLARKMAEKIVGRAVELDPSVMGDIAAQALSACRSRGGSVLLRVHPDDVAAVESARPMLLGRIAEAADVRVVVDASVGRLGCVVETPAGRLDARLQTQLDALERALREAGSLTRGRDV
jgi:flagellar biosynthesis/type III secretory pathway protein FliH